MGGLALRVARAINHDHLLLPALLVESLLIHVKYSIWACIALYDVSHVLSEDLP